MQQLDIEHAADNWSAPERVALVSSVDAEGHPNLIAVGWAMRANMDPPVMVIGLGKKSLSCANIAASSQFVFAVPGADLATQVLYCGTHSGREVDKFAATGLTAVPASQVQPVLVQECLSNLECQVIAMQEIGDHRLFFGQVQAVWTSQRDETRPLVIIGDGAGYETVAANAVFRLGAVRA